MGLLDWLRGRKVAVPPRTEFAFPSAPFASPEALIGALVTELHRRGSDDEWVTLTARKPGPGAEIVIQIAERTLNLGNETADVRGILEREGLVDLGARVRDLGGALHEIPGATPAELAAAADRVFRVHFGLGPSYPLSGSLDS